MLPSRNKPVVDRRLIAETGVIPNGLQFIRDTYRFVVKESKDLVTEGVDGRENHVMRVMGLFQEGDKPNANQRLYGTKDVLAPAVGSIQEDVARRSVLGEYDHPQDAKVHMDRISHLITKVWMEGRKVYGEAEVLHKVTHGANLRGLFEHKVEVGISSRGVGDMEVVESNGQEMYRVMPGYSFVTWDVVAEPSVSGAILNIQESLNRQLKPIKERRRVGLLSEAAYEQALLSEINRFYGLDKPKRVVGRSGRIS